MIDLRGRRRRGRPTGAHYVWVDYAVNGQVDVNSLNTSLKVYKALIRSLESSGTRPTNQWLWLEVVKERRKSKPAAAECDVDVQRSIVARHLARAREAIRAVRVGKFPYERRERGRGLG